MKTKNQAQHSVRKIIEALGEDIGREGLVNTPKRYVNFLEEFFTPIEFEWTVFDAEGNDEMIVQTNIPFFSLCEHHMLPFFGVAHVAYIPNGKIVGLSKLARCVDKHSHALQNQERITTNVADEVESVLDAKGSACIITARHLCMEMRGVKTHNAETTTSALRGVFRTDPTARAEFMNIVMNASRS